MEENSNEPLFIIRAQDELAEGALITYYESAKIAGCTQLFLDDLLEIISKFHTWATDNPDRMKIPD